MADEGGFGGENPSTTWDLGCISSMEEEDVENQVYDNETYMHVGSYEGSSSSNDQNLHHRMNLLQEIKGSNWLEESNQPIIGLTLKKTPSLLNYIQTKLANNSSSIEKRLTPELAENLKASIIPFLFLQIGSWQLESRHQGNLVAKCYFAKHKLIWEILEGSLKRRLEISWSDVIGLQVSVTDDGYEVLDVELNQPPSFAKALNPLPRRHAQWSETHDFTEGQALIHRRHHLKFLPGNLDKLYNKLLQHDERILRLSEEGFPTCPSPYFNTNDFDRSKFLPFKEYPPPMVPTLQLPPSNGFSTPIPGYLPDFRTFTNSDEIMSGSNFQLEQGGVDMAYGILQQHSNNRDMLHTVEQNHDLQPVPESVFPATVQNGLEFLSPDNFPYQSFNGMFHLPNIAALSSRGISQGIEHARVIGAVQTIGLNETNPSAFRSVDPLGIVRERGIDEQIMESDQGNPTLNEGVTLHDLLLSLPQEFITPTTNNEAYQSVLAALRVWNESNR